MNPSYKLVELVNEWDKFEKGHPAGTIFEFCTDFLAKNSSNYLKSNSKNVSAKPQLLKVMSRLANIYQGYHKIAMHKIELPFSEAFFYLATLKFMGEMKKTELINHLLIEYTTGMEGINKLLQAELIVERTDETDKRAKIIKLTKEGENAFLKSFTQVSLLAELVLKDLSEESAGVCLRLLEQIEENQLIIAHELKNKSYEEIIKRLKDVR